MLLWDCCGNAGGTHSVYTKLYMLFALATLMWCPLICGLSSWLMSADKVVPDSWRIKNSNDFVTRIPSLLGYQHIGVEVNTPLSRQLVHIIRYDCTRIALPQAVEASHTMEQCQRCMAFRKGASS